jgi:hypothetical protein
MTHEMSRRDVLRWTPAAAAVIAVASLTRPPQARAQQKVTKATVQYRDSPKAGHECSGCSNFVGPNACKVVSGTISPHGWCSIWTPR